MSEEIIYRYLDNNIKNKREESLKKFLKEQQINNEELRFFDLEMYNEDRDLKSKINGIIFRSKFNKNVILTKYQIEILDILSCNNIFLSAPTSFGKTFIMLEYIKRNIESLNNIIFIIPTIALMNELLKKMYDNFRDDYNICINGNEVIKEKNIFVFVPERSDAKFLEEIKNIEIDFLVFDEIYKLQGNRRDVKKDDRLIFMNKVYLDLVNKANKIALLGPYINSVEFENTRLDIVKYYSNFMPVYNDIDILKENEKWKDKINLVDNQLIYFRTPKSIYNSIDELLSNIPENEYYKNIYKDEIKFLEETIGEEWYVVDLLKRGIGIHHGKTPMFLRKFYENEYNIGNMKILLCTNTLMEGINTPTESLLIVDNPGDAFKLNNLMGRVGRLNPSKPKIGKIVLCDRSILSYMKDNNSWLDLKIRAEDVEIFSDDEVLYLNKRYLEKSKQEEYNNKIRKLKENYNISTEDMIERNLELNKTLNLFEKNIYNEIINSKNLYECVVATVKLIPSVSYFFNKTQYKNLNLNIDFLPYKTYIVDILVNKSFKDIIKDFNIKYNTTRNIENINIFIDALYNLNNYIKFKFSKIINYLEVVKKEISNENVKKFISLISSFNNSEVSYKILDDLGIETNDAQKIIKVLNISNDISASSMMNILKENKIKLLKENLSPFSKNNIESI